MRTTSRARLSALALVLTLAGCATATALQKADGTLEIVGTSSAEDNALEAALDKGLEACKKSSQTFVVLERQSSYRGIDPNVRTLINIASTLTKGGFYGAGSSSSDWRVVLLGRCQ